MATQVRVVATEPERPKIMLFFIQFKWAPLNLFIFNNGAISHKFSVGKYYIKIDNQTLVSWEELWLGPVSENLLSDPGAVIQWGVVSGQSSGATIPGAGLSVTVTDPGLQALGQEHPSTDSFGCVCASFEYLGQWEREVGPEGSHILQRQNREGDWNQKHDHWQSETS